LRITERQEFEEVFAERGALEQAKRAVKRKSRDLDSRD